MKRERRKFKKALRPTASNAGIRADYRRRLMRLIVKMGEETEKEIRGIYEHREERIALDASPAVELSKKINAIRERWEKRFEKEAFSLSKWFVNRVQGYVRRSQKTAVQESKITDISVRYDKGLISRDMMSAIVEENVSLIKSIPSMYFAKIEGSVMRSVTAGRDLYSLTQELQKHYGVTERRAALIARDQNDKATNSIARANSIKAGFKRGVWIHVAGQKTSRESHVRMNGKEFDLSKGMYDSTVQKYVFPAELVGCRCRFRPIFDLEEWQ